MDSSTREIIQTYTGILIYGSREHYGRSVVNHWAFYHREPTTADRHLLIYGRNSYATTLVFHDTYRSNDDTAITGGGTYLRRRDQRHSAKINFPFFSSVTFYRCRDAIVDRPYILYTCTQLVNRITLLRKRNNS